MSKVPINILVLYITIFLIKNSLSESDEDDIEYPSQSLRGKRRLGSELHTEVPR